jgi:hypothetical protein
MKKYRRKSKKGCIAVEHNWITETVYTEEPDISFYDLTYCTNCNKIHQDNEWDKLMSEV